MLKFCFAGFLCCSSIENVFKDKMLYLCTSKTRIKYNTTLLNEYVDKDHLIGEYPKLNRDTRISGKCLTDGCGGDFEKAFRQIVEKGGSYCNICTEKNRYSKIKKTNLATRGVENPSQDPSIKQKKEDTNMEKRGVKSSLQDPIIKEQIKKTNIERYGAENVFASKIIKEKIKETLLANYGVEHPSYSPKIRQKRVDTFLAKSGYNYPGQDPNVKLKIKETIIQRYNVTHYMLLEEFQNKVAKTCIEKYGVSCPLQNEEIRNKGSITCIEKYGVSNAMQSPEILLKSQKNAFTFKDYTLPSGKIIKLQGYEHYAFNILLESYLESDLITGTSNVPIIWYTCDDGKTHRHYVDFFIPKDNKCIEVKSTWTFDVNKDKVLLKKKAANNNGLIYEIWIFGNNGKTLKIIY